MNCNICLTDDVSIDKIKFLDCRHYICLSCFDKLVRNTCPYCRAIIHDKEDGHYPPVNYDLSSFYQEDIYGINSVSNYSFNNYDFDYLYNYYITKRSTRLRNRNNRLRKKSRRDKEILLASKKKKRKNKKNKQKLERTIYYGSDNEEIITMTYSNYLSWVKKDKKKYKHKKRRNTC
jgi:hypothetical protein